jgi:hypothetical protein
MTWRRKGTERTGSFSRGKITPPALRSPRSSCRRPGQALSMSWVRSEVGVYASGGRDEGRTRAAQQPPAPTFPVPQLCSCIARGIFVTFVTMRFNTLLIVSILVLFIAAPIVDATACDDCRDIIPLRDRQQLLTNGADRSETGPTSSDDGHSAPQDAGTERDLCPVCANVAAAMGHSCYGAPYLTSHLNQLPQLFAQSDPSYPITKPPQN